MAKKSTEHKVKSASTSIKSHTDKTDHSGAKPGGSRINQTKGQGRSLSEGTSSKRGCLPMLFVLLLPSITLGVYLLFKS